MLVQNKTYLVCDISLMTATERFRTSIDKCQASVMLVQNKKHLVYNGSLKWMGSNIGKIVTKVEKTTVNRNILNSA